MLIRYKQRYDEHNFLLFVALVTLRIDSTLAPVREIRDLRISAKLKIDVTVH